ncbi:MAG: hypothetical protein RBT75_03670 [Anaerolineae bacterium]|jgi:hypothetical protein|nr:hypothetical protein [Anaerolineae bacterium]
MKKMNLGRWWVIVLLLASGCRGIITDGEGTPATPVVTVEGIAVVESVEVLLLESFPVQVRVLVRGDLPDGCTALGDWRVSREGDTFKVTLPTTRLAEALCTEALVPFEVSIPLEVAGLPAGTYGVEVNGVAASFTFDVDNVLDGAAFPPAAEGARFVLGQVLGVSDVTIVSAEAASWSDACLDLAAADEVCAQEVTPGYIVTLAAGQARYVYHVDETGGNVRLAQAPPVALEAPVLWWQQASRAGCRDLLMTLEHGAAGRCASPRVTAPLGSDWVARNLPYFVATYAPFASETPGGTVVFTGTGTLAPSPIEQRSLAEFARVAAGIVESGHAGASYGRALVLHQEGGLAGICRDFEFTLAGEVFISRCGPGAPEAAPLALAYGRLTAAELERLYALLDTTAPFEWADPTATAYDGLAQELSFMGWGAALGGEVEAQALIALAGELASRLLAGE